MKETIDKVDLSGSSAEADLADFANSLSLSQRPAGDFIISFISYYLILVLNHLENSPDLNAENPSVSSTKHYSLKDWYAWATTKLGKDNIKLILKNLLSKSPELKSNTTPFSVEDSTVDGPKCVTSEDECVTTDSSSVSSEGFTISADSTDKKQTITLLDDTMAVDAQIRSHDGHKIEELNLKKIDTSAKSDKKVVKSVRFSNKVILHYFN